VITIFDPVPQPPGCRSPLRTRSSSLSTAVTLAPSGWYPLFVADSGGLPANGTWVHLTP
jgi:hypothetical protein